MKHRQGICNHANLLTGKLYCTHCGAAYYRRDSVDKDGTKNSKWVCSGKIKNGADSCPSFAIYEDEIKPVLFEVFKDTAADTDALVEEYISMYKELDEGSDTVKQLAALRRQIEVAGKKKAKLLEFSAMGELSNQDFLAMNKQCAQEIEEAQRGLVELEHQQNSKEEFKSHIAHIRRVLQEAARDAADGIISKEFVDKYIDKIFASPEGDGVMRLTVKIFTGESTDKFLQNLAGRTGHTFKKMIEAYESGMN